MSGDSMSVCKQCQAGGKTVTFTNVAEYDKHVRSHEAGGSTRQTGARARAAKKRGR